MSAFSMVSGTLFSMRTSHFAMSRRKSSRPSGVLMSAVIELVAGVRVERGPRFQGPAAGRSPGSRRRLHAACAPRCDLLGLRACSGSAPRVCGCDAGDRLDADHLGAPLREQLRAVGARPDDGDVEHAHALERQRQRCGPPVALDDGRSAGSRRRLGAAARSRTSACVLAEQRRAPRRLARAGRHDERAGRGTRPGPVWGGRRSPRHRASR